MGSKPPSSASNGKGAGEVKRRIQNGVNTTLSRGRALKTQPDFPRRKKEKKKNGKANIALKLHGLDHIIREKRKM